MSIRTEPWPTGTPCWVDLTTPDVAAASAFYRAVLPWHLADPDPEYGNYVMARVDGSAAAGIGPAQGGAPTAWTLYLASDDVDAHAEAITAHGGTVLMPPFDVGPQGRMCVATDPTGAAFGVWQAGVHSGAQITGEPGGLAWEDLRSTDPDAARAFYAAVFGFDYQPLPAASADYTTFSHGGTDRPLGGMGGMMGAEGAPSHWLVYFAVADADAAVAAAQEGGGSVLVPAFDSPFGRMAGVADPWGASFWVHQDTSGAAAAGT